MSLPDPRHGQPHGAISRVVQMECSKPPCTFLQLGSIFGIPPVCLSEGKSFQLTKND